MHDRQLSNITKSIKIKYNLDAHNIGNEIFCFYFYIFANDFPPMGFLLLRTFFLFAECSPSYGRRPVLGPVSYLFPVTFLFVHWSAETRLENSVLLLKATTNFSPSILSRIKRLNQRLHGCILNCTLRQLIIQVQRMG